MGEPGEISRRALNTSRGKASRTAALHLFGKSHSWALFILIVLQTKIFAPCAEAQGAEALIRVNREAFAHFGNFYFYFIDNLIRVTCFQRIKNVANPMSELHTFRFTKAASSHRWRTNTNTGGHKG